MKPDDKKQIRSIALMTKANKKLEKNFISVSLKMEQMKNNLSNLNHDLRSPLSGITGMIDLMIIEDEEQHEVQTSDLLMIKHAAQSILQIVNASLNYDDSADNLTDSEEMKRKLSSAMMEVSRLYQPMAKNKGISLSLRTQINTKVHLPQSLYNNLVQITGNLVGNAIKFTPSGGSIEVIYTLDVDEHNSTLKMTVSDTGKGMSEDQVSAFNKGEPVSRSNGTNGEVSYGMGLKHISQMVSEDKGQIVLKSENGSGSEFTLSFSIPGKNVVGKNTSHFRVRNGTISHNGVQS